MFKEEEGRNNTGIPSWRHRRIRVVATIFWARAEAQHDVHCDAGRVETAARRTWINALWQCIHQSI